jgi:uncharacterized RDD family membrane protein YckC
MIDFFNNYYKKNAKECTSSRFIASFIDNCFILGICITIIVIFGEKVKANSYHLGGIKAMAIPAIWISYFIILEKECNGTLGRRLMKIQVVSLKESKLTYLQIIKRRLCDPIDIWWCFGLLGILLIKKTEFSQRIGDMWAQTIVIKTTAKSNRGVV